MAPAGTRELTFSVTLGKVFQFDPLMNSAACMHVRRYGSDKRKRLIPLEAFAMIRLEVRKT